MSKFVRLGFFWLILCSKIVAQDSTAVVPDGISEIKLTTYLDRQEVPKNRLVTYTAQIEWFGNLAAYQITAVKDPDTENLAIVKNATVHRTEVKDGKPIAVKKLEFVLEPQSLGMGYVGDVSIRYQNVLTGEEGQLITNRLGVKILEPVAEPGSRLLFIPKTWFLPLLLILGGAGLAVLLGLKWRQRREIARKQADALTVQVPLEQQYLQILKEKVDLNASELSRQFAEVSHIFRQYLGEKFSIPTLETTTVNILLELQTKIENEKVLSSANEILKTCDLAKFGGGGLEISTLSRVYSLVETLLENAPVEHQNREAGNSK
jgi:hypothetical protein